MAWDRLLHSDGSLFLFLIAALDLKYGKLSLVIS